MDYSTHTDKDSGRKVASMWLDDLDALRKENEDLRQVLGDVYGIACNGMIDTELPCMVEASKLLGQYYPEDGD